MHVERVIAENSPGTFSIRVVRKRRRGRICLLGELDITGTDSLRTAAKQCLLVERSTRAVTLDLQELSFVDLHGLRAIFDTFQFLRSHGVIVDICSVSPRVKRLAELAGLHLPLA